MLNLYGYYRSTAAYRVRIALDLKGVDYDQIPVHLVRGGGEQHSPEYRRKNPAGLVPALETEDGVITQSLSIIDYIDRRWPEPALLPEPEMDRAWVYALALDICCDLHPLNNLRVLKYLTGDLGLSEDDKLRWYRHWIATGFAAIEQKLEQAESGDFCHGDQPSLADCCLVPQVYNAHRFNCPMDAYPRINRIHAHCSELPAFAASHPDNQPDAEPTA